jgi:hypothetical protein
VIKRRPVAFVATDGRKDQAEDLNGLNGGPFEKK